MKTAYIFHDAFGSPLSDWYPWMKTTLEGMGYLVIVPAFPTPGAQSYESWKVVIKNYIPTFDEETVLVGHGTGGIFALRLVEESARHIGGLFLVASYAEAIGNVGFDRLNRTFFDHPFDWEKIKSNAMSIRIFAGSDDPFVPGSATANLSANLSQEAEIIPDGGHVNKAAGFSQAVAVAQGIRESIGAIDRSIQIEREDEQPAPTRKESARETDAAGKESAEVPEPPVPETKSRTMMQDLSRLVNSNQGSVASSLLSKARTDKENREAVSVSSPKNILYTLGIILSLGGTVAIGGYLVAKYAPAPAAARPETVVSLIPAEDHRRIDVVQSQPGFMLAQKIRSSVELPVANGQFRDIYYATGSGRASFAQTLAGLGTSYLPDGLAKQFPDAGQSPSFMHGTAEANGVTGRFLIVRTEDYDTSFTLMKQWETGMLRDIGPFMGISDAFLRTRLSKDSFGDELISNKNARVLRYAKPPRITLDEPVSNASEESATGSTTTGTAGNFVSEGIKAATANNPFVDSVSPYRENEIMLAYFFLNEHTVVITDKAEIIPEILKRWANRQIYQ